MYQFGYPHSMCFLVTITTTPSRCHRTSPSKVSSPTLCAPTFFRYNWLSFYQWNTCKIWKIVWPLLLMMFSSKLVTFQWTICMRCYTAISFRKNDCKYVHLFTVANSCFLFLCIVPENAWLCLINTFCDLLCLCVQSRNSFKRCHCKREPTLVIAI